MASIGGNAQRLEQAKDMQPNSMPLTTIPPWEPLYAELLATPLLAYIQNSPDI